MTSELVERLRKRGLNHGDFGVASMMYEAAAEIERLTAQLAEAREALAQAKEEGVRLRTALHDAIRRPMGVVPASADEFYSPAEADAAERRRVARSAALSELIAADAHLIDVPGTLGDSDGDDGA